MANKKCFSYFADHPNWFYDDLDEYFESLEQEDFFNLNLDIEVSVLDGKTLYIRCHLENGEATFKIEDYNYVVHDARQVRVDCETALVIELQERIFHPETFLKT